MHRKLRFISVLRLVFGISLAMYLLINIRLPQDLAYYTYLSNFIVAFWFITNGLAGWISSDKHNLCVQHIGLKTAATTYIIITGLVYCTVLIPVELQYRGFISFNSILTHMIVPLIMIVDFFVLSSPTKTSRWSAAAVMIFPVLYLTFTLINGSRTGFYPYGFINPSVAGTTNQLLLNIALLSAMHIVIAIGCLGFIQVRFNRTVPKNH